MILHTYYPVIELIYIFTFLIALLLKGTKTMIVGDHRVTFLQWKQKHCEVHKYLDNDAIFRPLPLCTTKVDFK